MTITEAPTAGTSAPPVIDPGSTRSSNRLPKVLAILAVLVVALGAFTVASLAVFTDSAIVDDNTFTTSNVDIATSPTTQAFNPGPISPGDRVYATIRVTNSGTVPLRYALTSSTTEDVLAGQLQLTVLVGTAPCNDANFASNTSLYVGELGDATTPAPIFGTAAQGGGNGERTLAAAAFEDLCLRVALPLGVNNTSEGLTTTATFGFEAEQTANN